MYGNLQVLDGYRDNQTTVANFGEEAVAEVFATVLEAHNTVLNDMIEGLFEQTTERILPYGGVEPMEMRRVDEFGAVDTQKVGAGQNLGLPLHLHQIAIGWTRKSMQNRTVADLTKQFLAANDADVRQIFRELQRTLFNPLNNLAYKDKLTDGLNLELRALLNGDGFESVDAFSGDVFTGTHTHYTASSSFTEEDALGLIENVREHGVSGSLVLFVNPAQENTIRNFAGFSGYTDARLIMPNTDRYAEGALDMINVDNRAIGILGAAEVWTKPWIVPSYEVALDMGVDVPFGIRTRNGGFGTGSGSLAIAAEHEHYPLRAQFMEREYGLGVIRREKAAVHYSGGTDYVAPSFA